MSEIFPCQGIKRKKTKAKDFSTPRKKKFCNPNDFCLEDENFSYHVRLFASFHGACKEFSRHTRSEKKKFPAATFASCVEAMKVIKIPPNVRCKGRRFFIAKVLIAWINLKLFREFICSCNSNSHDCATFHFCTIMGIFFTHLLPSSHSFPTFWYFGSVCLCKYWSIVCLPPLSNALVRRKFFHFLLVFHSSHPRYVFEISKHFNIKRERKF